jgi:predicted GIY-YIG superfamily endonuclease
LPPDARPPLAAQRERGRRLTLAEKRRKQGVKAADTRRHYSVYVVYLRNPRGDGKAGYYVGMTGLTPEQRLANHKSGLKSARVVKRCGERLVPRLYAHLNPMTYAEAVEAEPRLAEELKALGYQVFGGH